MVVKSYLSGHSTVVGEVKNWNGGHNHIRVVSILKE